MRVKFWGTRGSLAVPGASTLRYGGNTSCVEVVTDDGMLIVLDCGTGAHGLGQKLLASGQRPGRGHLLITHTHWDHIQGFPFFAPLFVPGSEWDLYAPQGLGQRLEETLSGQMVYTYFPVTLDQLGATIRCHDLLEGSFDLGGVHVIARYLNHPALTLGYRLEIGGAVMVYATDHEPHARGQIEPNGEESSMLHPVVHQEDRQHIEFLSGADLIIHDSQYTLEEYPRKVGWGHTPAELAVDFAVAAGARRIALFHHDPLRSDEGVDALVEACRLRSHGALEVFAAAEGLEIELPEHNVATAHLARPAPLPESSTAAAQATGQMVLIVDDDPDIVLLLTEVLQPEGFRLLTASDGDTALRMARTARPSLIILDWLLPGLDGLEVCRMLRADPDPDLREVPVVLLTGMTSSEDTASAFAAGVTDYLTKPFTPAHVRSRVHAWLLRSSHTGTSVAT